MRFLIVSHVVHKQVGNQFFAYGPYVREMNLWLKYVEEVVVLAPKVTDLPPDPIDLAYIHPQMKVIEVPEFDTLSFGSRLRLLVQVPLILSRTFVHMAQADHIHLRCPGNMGLIGCFVQIFFPKKKKSAKYAGNWDPNSPQPLTYRWQRSILANEFWTRNMKVLVYGNWSKKHKNLLNFFTASYTESEKVDVAVRSLNIPLQLIYVGSLHPGKNPLISCQALKIILKNGAKAQLHLYGEGEERGKLEEFIRDNRLEQHIFLHGNVNAQQLKTAYTQSHFLLFASETEGWPKAVAEAMFWGCLPLTTRVSCVPQMIGEGRRGDLVAKNPNDLAERVLYYLENPEEHQRKADLAMQWSRDYTLEKFESEVQKILIN